MKKICTNIAETSVTIGDAVYVVDTGRVKENRYNTRTTTAQLVNCWASRAAARQRRGRAGRVRPGECWRLFTSQVHDEFARGTTWARYVRLKIDQSGDCDGIRVNDYARIYEIRVLSAIAVRCCADATRKCYDEGEGGVSAVAGGGSGGGCAADSSLYLCGELGWTTKSTADAHVGGSSEVW